MATAVTARVLLRSVYLKTLRDARVAIAGWSIGLGLMMYSVLISYSGLVETSAARASLVTVAREFAWVAAPVAVDTPGGYALFKYGPLILLLAIWPLLACSRVLRGEEESGALDVLLSAPRSRLRVAVEKLAAIGTALLLIGVVFAVITYAGGVQAKAGYTFGDALLFGLDVALFSALMGAISLLVSQFARERRTATGVTAGLLLIFVVLDMVHRVFPAAGWVSQLSPVYYFYESKPLVPSYGTSVSGLGVLLGLTIAVSAAALWLFARRDVGGTAPLPVRPRAQQRQAELPGGWSLRSVYARSLARAAWPTFWWTLGIAGLGAWLVAVVQQTGEQLKPIYEGSPALRSFVAQMGGGATFESALLSSMFTFLPLLLMAFAITQSNRWTTDEDDGRLELVLATPHQRPRVMLAGYAALLTSVVIICVLTFATVAVVAGASGVGLDSGKLAAASFTMIPLGLLVGALGYFLSGWLQTAIDTGLLSLVVVAWFVVSFVGPELKWPDFTLRASAFYYYGSPLANGLHLADTVGVVAAAAAVLVLAVVRFSRKDLRV